MVMEPIRLISASKDTSYHELKTQNFGKLLTIIAFVQKPRSTHEAVSKRR